MGTKSTTHFCNGLTTQAIVYRHWEGYPGRAGTDILRFLREVKRDVEDTRFTDPSYLAAKYVVWLARKFCEDAASPMDFLSVGVVVKDPCDIDFRYQIRCDRIGEDGFPEVECRLVNYSYPEKIWTEGDLVEIPLPDDD